MSEQTTDLSDALLEIRELRDACDERDAELRMIDNVMARRPALDQPTRWQNIEKAIHMAGKADDAIRRAEDRRRAAVSSTIPVVHRSPREGWSFTECGRRRAAFDASGDWDDVTCKLCLRTKRRRERFASAQRARETPADPTEGR